MKHTIKSSEFTEEDYISAIETLVSHCFFGTDRKTGHFVEISRISQDKERELGYDGVLTSLVPFYLQFKRSSFYTPSYSGKLASDRNTAFTPRHNKGFLGFPLHKNRKTREHEQHNALWELSKKSSAAYVAPLFYKSKNLTELKERLPRYPWTYKTQLIDDRYNSINYHLRAIKTFNNSIVITPHREINDKKAHHYTYDRSANFLAFHSDIEKIEGQPINLFDHIVELIRSTLEGEPREDTSLSILHILPNLFSLSWSAKEFREMLKNHLIEADLMPPSLPWDSFTFLADNLDISDRFFLIEGILKEELDIIQHTIRIK